MLSASRVPPLSVVMPVKNAEPFLDAAIDSILNQTFSDFEFIILDDASTDGTLCAARKWAARDPRIRVERSCRSLGLTESSNAVVALTRAEIIARMDGDDVSHSDRFRRQLKVLAEDEKLGLIGTLADGIDGAGRSVRPRDRWRIARRSRYVPFPHGSIMFRRSVFDAVGGYRDVGEPEDLDLFHRMAQIATVAT